MNQVRVRYAPSPTGDFHVGGARTALFNWLFARHHQGVFILRIEDTDRKRYNENAISWLENGLKFLGLNWDEGPDIGGDYGPYTQSERLDIYQHYCSQLISQGHAYRCFCTPDRLDSVRKERAKQKMSYGYDRSCRHINEDESAERAVNGEPFTVRIKMPLKGEVTITDLIMGDISFNYEEMQDSVIMKTDGIPTYHLANVIDDHLMEISHVLRGSEWVNSLPLHKKLYDYFNWEMPALAHLPLILNPTGKGKMSKREDKAPDGTLLPVFVRTFEELGYLPEAMVNYMALLGWSYDDKTEMMTLDELIDRFSLSKVNTAPAAWNYKKLDHLNGQYIRKLPAEIFTIASGSILEIHGIDVDIEKVRPTTPLIQERITKFSEIPEKIDFFFVNKLPEYNVRSLIPKKSDLNMSIKVLEESLKSLSGIEFNHDTIHMVLREKSVELGIKAGVMFQPIRVAVCGKMNAPPLFETLEVLGKEKSLSRIAIALEKLNQVKQNDEYEHRKT